MTSPYPTRGVVTAASLAALYTDAEVFPNNLPGLDFTVEKTPSWSTQVQRAASGGEVTYSFYSAPLYNFDLRFNVLRDGAEATRLGIVSELQRLLAFFNARRGRFGFFYLLDPTDYQVTTSQGFGTGDGSSRTFQLVRTVGYGSPYATTEPVYALWNAPVVTVAGVTKTYGTDYTIAPWGQITFTSAPANGAALAWTGSFLFVCRFDQDTMKLEQLYTSLWRMGGLSIVSKAP